MKQAIHPQYFDNAQVICVCGNKFTTGSTQEIIHVELCYNCHPFYTGEQKFVDTASRIQKFQNRTEAAKKYQVVDKRNIKISGKTLPDAKIVILTQNSEEAATPTRDGSFSTDINLSDDENIIEISAIGPNGEIVKVKRVVSYSTENF